MTNLSFQDGSTLKESPKRTFRAIVNPLKASKETVSSTGIENECYKSNHLSQMISMTKDSSGKVVSDKVESQGFACERPKEPENVNSFPDSVKKKFTSGKNKNQGSVGERSKEPEDANPFLDPFTHRPSSS